MIIYWSEFIILLIVRKLLIEYYTNLVHNNKIEQLCDDFRENLYSINPYKNDILKMIWSRNKIEMIKMMEIFFNNEIN